jgi:hypothetical protein
MSYYPFVFEPKVSWALRLRRADTGVGCRVGGFAPPPSLRIVIDVPLCPVFRLGGIGCVAGFLDRPFTGLNLQQKLETQPSN